REILLMVFLVFGPNCDEISAIASVVPVLKPCGRCSVFALKFFRHNKRRFGSLFIFILTVDLLRVS
ncbi:MAG: hypothetical protein ACOCV9_09010, partial [Marinilabiliaceae bacterium]